ncbi:hypothetical protein CYMTET_3208 [Cymbomonas tetramitiformis]|uniref:Protein kinase domain-containing protein n=1 Tax=Cymbomonas tetramitiformis TaxID=36881 RepID=A0AAE0H3R7_9CHLO|nr:hypothetical protein CYMTET_3208 [Cymbomonas tetramitiformis]
MTRRHNGGQQAHRFENIEERDTRHGRSTVRRGKLPSEEREAKGRSVKRALHRERTMKRNRQRTAKEELADVCQGLDQTLRIIGVDETASRAEATLELRESTKSKGHGKRGSPAGHIWLGGVRSKSESSLFFDKVKQASLRQHHTSALSSEQGEPPTASITRTLEEDLEEVAEQPGEIAPASDKGSDSLEDEQPVARTVEDRSRTTLRPKRRAEPDHGGRRGAVPERRRSHERRQAPATQAELHGPASTLTARLNEDAEMPPQSDLAAVREDSEVPASASAAEPLTSIKGKLPEVLQEVPVKARSSDAAEEAPGGLPSWGLARPKSFSFGSNRKAHAGIAESRTSFQEELTDLLKDEGSIGAADPILRRARSKLNRIHSSSSTGADDAAANVLDIQPIQEDLKCFLSLLTLVEEVGADLSTHHISLKSAAMWASSQLPEPSCKSPRRAAERATACGAMQSATWALLHILVRCAKHAIACAKLVGDNVMPPPPITSPVSPKANTAGHYFMENVGCTLQEVLDAATKLQRLVIEWCSLGEDASNSAELRGDLQALQDLACAGAGAAQALPGDASIGSCLAHLATSLALAASTMAQRIGESALIAQDIERSDSDESPMSPARPIHRRWFEVSSRTTSRGVAAYRWAVTFAEKLATDAVKVLDAQRWPVLKGLLDVVWEGGRQAGSVMESCSVVRSAPHVDALFPGSPTAPSEPPHSGSLHGGTSSPVAKPKTPLHSAQRGHVLAWAADAARVVLECGVKVREFLELPGQLEEEVLERADNKLVKVEWQLAVCLTQFTASWRHGMRDLPPEKLHKVHRLACDAVLHMRDMDEHQLGSTSDMEHFSQLKANTEESVNVLLKARRLLKMEETTSSVTLEEAAEANPNLAAAIRVPHAAPSAAAPLSAAEADGEEPRDVADLQSSEASSSEREGWCTMHGFDFWESEFPQLVKKIGDGSFGRVFVGKWNMTNIAIKVMDTDVPDLDDLWRSFWREINFHCKLHHPNIVRFLGACTKNKAPALLLELCERGSLYDIITRAKKNGGGLDWSVRLRYALDAAKAMVFLHNKHVIHRDLKSPNLLVDRGNVCKVSDFGLSRVSAGTEPGVRDLFNPRWAAPELLRGEDYDKSVDVYSFGTILWELATLCMPFKAENVDSEMALMYRIEHCGLRPEFPNNEDAQVNAIVGMPCEYVKLCEDCWQEPSKRPTFVQVTTRLESMYKNARMSR